MNAFTQRTAGRSVVAWTGVVLGFSALAMAQTTQPATPPATPGQQQGRIKGDNVYVRSGSHTNYYPVTKLNRGDPVTVVGEQYGWLEILPPPGTFSLIEKTYVDRSGDTGKLSDDRRVYAGSNLDNRRYAVQAKLAKGDTVRVLGETEDGAFLKIEPPAGAHLWVKADFVEGVTVAGTSPAVKQPDKINPGDLELEGDLPKPPTTRPAVTNDAGRSAPGGSSTRTAPKLADKPTKLRATQKYQAQIDAIEAKIAAAKGKPGFEQFLGTLIAQLKPISTQREDEIAGIYAKARIRQIEGYLAAQDGLRKIDEARERAIREADRKAAERLGLVTAPVPPPDEIVVKGEIRVSTIYEGLAGGNRRWRVVEPNGTYSAKTLAYIELPPDSPIDPTSYYGKLVGIRASGVKTLRETNPPTLVYTVAEIVVLDRESGTNGRVGGSSAYASPTGPSVKPPSSQPSSTTEEMDPGEPR